MSSKPYELMDKEERAAFDVIDLERERKEQEGGSWDL
jgi:hypothetical protein